MEPDRELTPSDIEEEAFFGWSVALSGDRAVVGAEQFPSSESGTLYGFELDTGAGVERFRFRRTGLPFDDDFSRACAFDGATLVGGAPGDAIVPGGAAYVLDSPFERAECVSGSVNSAEGPIADVLYVNGSTGPDGGRVVVEEGALIWGAMLPPPGGGPGKYVVHANLGVPSESTVTVLPASIGTFCFELLLSQGATPAAIWNNIGKETQVGASRYFDGSPVADPDPAPSVFVRLFGGDPANLPAGSRVTFQGVLVDPGSASAKGASATNAVVLVIE